MVVWTGRSTMHGLQNPRNVGVAEVGKARVVLMTTTMTAKEVGFSVVFKCAIVLAQEKRRTMVTVIKMCSEYTCSEFSLLHYTSQIPGVVHVRAATCEEEEFTHTHVRIYNNKRFVVSIKYSTVYICPIQWYFPVLSGDTHSGF